MSKQRITWINLFQEKRIPNLKRHRWVVKAHKTTTELSHICVPQQYRWNMMIEAEWEDLQQTNSPCDIFTRFDH